MGEEPTDRDSQVLLLDAQSIRPLDPADLVPPEAVVSSTVNEYLRIKRSGAL